MDNKELEAWVETQREGVEFYLTRHGIENPVVGPWPAFQVAPYVTIWAVESKKVAGKIGWWAFSGDCPTDYVSEDGSCHPRNALRNLLAQWRAYVPHLKNGRQPPGVRFHDKGGLPMLGNLLEARIPILEEWLLDDDLWEDR